MAPIEFRHRSTCNYIGTWTIIKMESQRMVLKQKWFLLANMLTPLLYFFFIINALSPMLGTVRFDGHSVNYEAYALVGLMAMNLIGQMGKTMYRISSDRKNGLFALKMDAGCIRCSILWLWASRLSGGICFRWYVFIYSWRYVRFL